MLIPKLVGALAAFLVFAALALALVKARGVRSMVYVAIGLAAETEIRYRDCITAEPKYVVRPFTRQERLAIALDPLSDEDVSRGVREEVPRSCERWPW